jgi:hypothetical protein
VQHKERTVFYEQLTHEYPIPVIVTLIEEQIQVYEGVPLVPVQKLDSFIGELDSHVDRNCVSGYDFSCYEEGDPLPDDPDDDYGYPGTGDF